MASSDLAIAVQVCGDGVAGRGTALLLAQGGVPVRLERMDRPRLPAILLSAQAIALLRDVFRTPSLCLDLPTVTERRVLWGGEEYCLPHAACVTSETRLHAEFAALPLEEAGEANWTVHCRRPLPLNVEEMRFGERMGWQAPVVIAGGARACAMESLPQGWLFLTPGLDGQAWLLAVGSEVEELLSQSRLVAPQLKSVGTANGPFSVGPRLAFPLHGESWLACGSAAVGFDPICGDGTAYAAREAVLVAAVLRGIHEGGDAQDLLAHYEERLIAGFARHLAHCREFYRSGGATPWWREQVARLDEGLTWCRDYLAPRTRVRYRLEGDQLFPIAALTT